MLSLILETPLNFLSISVSDQLEKTPQKTIVNGVTYVRSKSGNLLKSDLPGRVSKFGGACPYFTKTGTCLRGPSCQYAKHDKDHVALCKFYLLGTCSRPSCTLSHVSSPFNAPSCTYFLSDKCSNDKCKFSHVKPVNPNVICRDFAFNGYCEKGSSCEALHAFDCPDFYENGQCNRPACRLRHKEKPLDRQLHVVDKDEGIVNTLKLAESLFAQPQDSESDSGEDTSSEESSKFEDCKEVSVSEEKPSEDDLNNDFIKI